MYVTGAEFWQATLILSSLDADLRAVWSVAIWIMFGVMGLLVVALLRSVLGRE